MRYNYQTKKKRKQPELERLPKKKKNQGEKNHSWKNINNHRGYLKKQNVRRS